MLPTTRVSQARLQVRLAREAADRRPHDPLAQLRLETALEALERAEAEEMAAARELVA